jgi:serine/threonine protein phosphatase 1
MKFLKAGEGGQGWLQFGGDATIFSYGVQIPNHLPIDDRFRHIQASLQEAVPEHHINFCSQLELTYELGDYLFVHAGINPYEPLDRQSESDLLWIRDEFIGSDVNLGKVIVHGHTINDVPDVQEYRIGIDTGAYISGKLTCLVLEGDTKRFLSTK